MAYVLPQRKWQHCVFQCRLCFRSNNCMGILITLDLYFFKKMYIPIQVAKCSTFHAFNSFYVTHNTKTLMPRKQLILHYIYTVAGRKKEGELDRNYSQDIKNKAWVLVAEIYSIIPTLTLFHSSKLSLTDITISSSLLIWSQPALFSNLVTLSLISVWFNLCSKTEDSALIQNKTQKKHSQSTKSERYFGRATFPFFNCC